MQYKSTEKKEIYAHCLLFDGLRRSIPAKQSYFHHERLSEEIVANLDIRCIDALAGLRLPEGTTFAELQNGQVVSQPGKIHYESDDVDFDIHIVAAADIDYDGFEDIAALVLDQAKLGTFLDYRPVSLSRTSASGRIIANSMTPPGKSGMPSDEAPKPRRAALSGEMWEPEIDE